jgi:hypothetical protein
VPAFASPEDIARWLADKPRDAAVVLAARVALRVIPLAGTLHSDRQIDAVLGAFRCAQAAWAVAAYPGQAASAAAGAASHDDALRFASLAATYAFAAAASDQIRDDILKSCAADADALDERYSPATLCQSRSPIQRGCSYGPTLGQQTEAAPYLRR